MLSPPALAEAGADTGVIGGRGHQRNFAIDHNQSGIMRDFAIRLGAGLIGNGHTAAHEQLLIRIEPLDIFGNYWSAFGANGFEVARCVPIPDRCRAGRTGAQKNQGDGNQSK